jgi:hypothetical protein
MPSKSSARDELEQRHRAHRLRPELLEEVDVATGTVRSLGYFTQGILHSRQSGLYAFVAVDLVVNTTGDSADQPPLAAIKAPAAQG